MNITTTLEQAAITGLVDLWGHGSLFTRVMDEIHRNNAVMPHATGAEKRTQVLADLKVIFSGLLVPVGERVLRRLLELGIAYIEADGA